MQQRRCLTHRRMEAPRWYSCSSNRVVRKSRISGVHLQQALIGTGNDFVVLLQVSRKSLRTCSPDGRRSDSGQYIVTV